MREYDCKWSFWRGEGRNWCIVTYYPSIYQEEDSSLCLIKHYTVKMYMYSSIALTLVLDGGE